MKKLLLFITAIFICGVSIAQTIRWHIGDTVYQTTTCNAGESITPPTVPEKFGYSFVRYDAYTPIEYLESTGTQYIDTGIYPDGLIRMKAKIQTIRNNGIYSAFSGVIHNGFTGVWQVVYPYNGGIDFNVSQEDIVFNGDYNGIQDFDVDQLAKKIECNGIVKNMNNTPIAVKPGHANIPLFKYQNEISPYNNYWYGKVFFVKVWDNGSLVRDFIPVIDKNGTPCMYDRVEHKFYYNAGTGQFIAGPIIGSGE